MTPQAGVHVAVAAGVFGAAIYALLAFGVILPQPNPAFGTDIYDAYFYRLLEGRFDLPLRMLRLEGHYAADGSGYLYHGIAPLLTRALLYPFVTLHAFPTAAFSIWFWSVIGTAIYHALVFQVLTKYRGALSPGLSLFVATSVWLPAPGLLLSSSNVIYHEPLSVAFAASAGAVYLLFQVALFGARPHRILLPLAILAALALHARPHVAVGIYAGALIIMSIALRKEFRAALGASLLSLAILTGAGFSLLALNEARFGSALQTHGEIGEGQPETATVYAPVFFGTDYAVTGRGVVFEEHGRFHAWRVLPNIFIYTLDTPNFADQLAAIHLAWTEPISGRGHIEAPHYGMIFVWPVWLFSAVVGFALAYPRLQVLRSGFPVLAVTGIAALFILSYPTVAFRYRIEVWPLLIALSLLSFPALVQRFGQNVLTNAWVMRSGLFCLVLSLIAVMSAVQSLNKSFRTAEGGKYGPWDAATCRAVVAHHDFAEADLARICIDPQAPITAWESR